MHWPVASSLTPKHSWLRTDWLFLPLVALRPKDSTSTSTVEALGGAKFWGLQNDRGEDKVFTRSSAAEANLKHFGAHWIALGWQYKIHARNRNTEGNQRNSATVLYHQEAKFMLLRVQTSCELAVTWFEMRKSEAITKQLTMTLWLENPNNLLKNVLGIWG